VTDTDAQRSRWHGDALLETAFATPDTPTTSTISDTVAHYLEALDFLFIAISKRGSERDSSYRRNSKGPR